MKAQRHRRVVGKSMTKTKGSLRSQRSIIEMSLINERSITVMDMVIFRTIFFELFNFPL